MSRHFQFLRGKTDISGLTEYISGSNSPPHPEHSQIALLPERIWSQIPRVGPGGGGDVEVSN